jgi:hypothetical protein
VFKEWWHRLFKVVIVFKDVTWVVQSGDCVQGCDMGCSKW